jgi:deoxyribodipyrimidine photolyase-related protein
VKTKQSCLVILGSQLFEPQFFQEAFGPELGADVFNSALTYMSEDFGFCEELKYHKSRIHFFLSAMRHFSQKIAQLSKEHHYFPLDAISKSENYISRFLKFAIEHKVQTVYFFELEDQFFAAEFERAVQNAGMNTVTKPSPMFICTRSDFSSYIKATKKPFMKVFYEQQRKVTKILMQDGQPTGGKYSFDEDNRLKLPLTIKPPFLPTRTPSQIELQVKAEVQKYFPTHPGDLKELWLPVTNEESQLWLKDFFQNRFADFGAYEDALAQHSTFVFHSVLSPMVNAGLITPRFVLDEAINYAAQHEVPLSSLEGFVRQIMGWREFIRGIYLHFGAKQKSTNFWNHSKKLSPCWYLGTTGIEPLDLVIHKVLKYGYCHHIERLMVASNMMLLCEVDPWQAYEWFMEMFVDSSDWVMTPNVFGMGLFSDGGVFATKPYICGSNYWVKMGAKKDESWSLGVDGLYWKFIEKNRTFFEGNHRLSMMPKLLDKMDTVKKQKLFAEAETMQSRLTTNN